MKNVKRISLWNGNPPSVSGLVGNEVLDPTAVLELTNVSDAELIIYTPEASINTGTAAIICPGGAYMGLAITSQGHDFAEWLTILGITGVVLKYRMPNGHSDIPLSDAKAAFDYVKNNAAILEIDENKIGLVGFSAGGHLAATLSTFGSKEDSRYRPYFSVLFYPVISMDAKYRQVDTYQNLLGNNPDQGSIDQFSCEKQVHANTPPTLLFVSTDDQVVLPVNSDVYYSALIEKHIPVSLHQFPQGDHAWGIKGVNMFGQEFKYIEEVKMILQKWLREYC
ncbi:Acetyl esterase/lipase [Myroides marinus]|uniref:Acetyl esterase/lipase n=1 Tax=Myroides marinus TaxID=703342 RepID=A0A1H6UWH2_9FLAO|nr:alpha/beta hydrolase [Myroides marinus]SEI92680.1 Acetyl esterase/lipase [Myroides marinus]